MALPIEARGRYRRHIRSEILSHLPAGPASACRRGTPRPAPAKSRKRRFVKGGSTDGGEAVAFSPGIGCSTSRS
jgi:hypothetical protein